MLPVVRELETEYAGRVQFEIVDYYNDANRPLRAQYGVRGHPSFVVLARDSRPSETLQGIVERQKLVDLIEAALAT